MSTMQARKLPVGAPKSDCSAERFSGTDLPLCAALLAVQNSTSTNALSTTAIWWAEDGWTGSCGVKIE